MLEITMLKQVHNCFMPKLWLNVFRFSTRVSNVVATCKCHFYTITLVFKNGKVVYLRVNDLHICLF